MRYLALSLLFLFFSCIDPSQTDVESEEITSSESASTLLLNDDFILLIEVTYMVSYRLKTVIKKTLRVKGDSIYISSAYGSWKLVIDSVILHESDIFKGRLKGHAGPSKDTVWIADITSDLYSIYPIGEEVDKVWNLTEPYIQKFESSFRNKGIIFKSSL